jgi:L-aspartate oxidase
MGAAPKVGAGAPVIVVGGGIAGLAVALSLAPLPVLVLSASPLGRGGSTEWAQGGIAAAVGRDDNPALHAEDTVAVGAGLTDPAVARWLAEGAPGAIASLEAWGAPFDRAADGTPCLGLEAGHSRRRILHAGGDGSGARILEALGMMVLRAPWITVRDGVSVIGLARDGDRVTGAVARHASGRLETLGARAVVLATGGVGGLFASTTNPVTSRGAGLMLGARAGAALRDIEFIQFHPTAIAVAPGEDPTGQGPASLPLASEALRGEGATLITGDGSPLMAGIPGGDLAPRDVVARAVAGEIARGGRVFLDARAALGARFADHFPTVHGHCRDHGLDPAVDPIPVRPAAHYHMGGLAVDDRGRTSVPGLWACGEVAATGLHGANRLASNSLIEAVVLARRLAEALRATPAPPATGVLGVVDPAVPDAAPAPIRGLMDAHLGVVREDRGLTLARDALLVRSEALGWTDESLLALIIAQAALDRRESRGAHCRLDHPDTLAEARPSLLTLSGVLGALGALPPSPMKARNA